MDWNKTNDITYELGGFKIHHCGHMTAIYPYTGETPDGAMIVAPNGFGFRLLADAKAALELLWWQSRADLLGTVVVGEVK